MLQNELYKQLFNQPSETPAVFLEQVIQKYPWFSAAHYFRLQQGCADADKQKTGLHFPNTLLLNYRLLVPEIHETYQLIEIPSAAESTAPSETPAVEVSVSENESVSTPQVVEQSIPETIVDQQVQTTTVPENETTTDTPSASNGNTSGELLIEPLHTTDYFASQGIKITEDIKQNDKLGKQLKSFTEWLKTMKKLPEASNAEVPVDKKVEEIAEKSNKELEIYTETLANVFFEQGKKEKAIEIYRKLILLNPDKSAYFAAKIDQLKD